jgi:hypothetical protein
MTRLGRATGFAGTLTALAIVALAVVLAGCLPRYAVGPLESDPGKGRALADEAYKLVRPVVGEQVDAPNPDNSPITKYLGDRMFELEENQPEWDVTRLADADYPDGQLYGFRDGSVLVLLVSPQPGPQLPPPGPDTGTKLDGVRVIRP